MKIKFNHKVSIYSGEYPLIYSEATPENETNQFMFEIGWVPYYDVWYQTKSARLKLNLQSILYRTK